MIVLAYFIRQMSISVPSLHMHEVYTDSDIIGERERANLVLGLDDFFYIYICTGVALRNLIGRFKHAQRANVRPAKTSSGQRVCRST